MFGLISTRVPGWSASSVSPSRSNACSTACVRSLCARTRLTTEVTSSGSLPALEHHGTRRRCFDAAHLGWQRYQVHDALLNVVQVGDVLEDRDACVEQPPMDRRSGITRPLGQAVDTDQR